MRKVKWNFSKIFFGMTVGFLASVFFWEGDGALPSFASDKPLLRGEGDDVPIPRFFLANVGAIDGVLPSGGTR